MWLLQLADLNMPLRSLTCVVAPPCMVLGVPIRLTWRQINVTLCRSSFSLMPEWSWCLRPTLFDELAKAPPRVVSSSYQMRTLCP